MKKIRVYFNISNYDTISVKYRILKGSDVIHEDIINTTEPFITIPYYSGASYELRYYAENIAGRMDEKIYKFNSPDILEGVFDISVQLANTKDSATISWNKVADSSGYTLYIYTPDTVMKLALNDTQYIFKPTAENDYAFAVECNGLMSQRTQSYHLYNKPIFGTNQKPLPPQLTAGYTYDVAMREASITINLTHSSSTDVVGSYLQIIFPDSTKEIYYLPNSPSALEKVKRQYIVKETSQFKFSAYSITIDNQVSDVVEYTLNVVPESTTPPTPSISQIVSGYDVDNQQPYIDISINPVSWVTPVDYNVAYRYGNNTEWSYARTSEISLRVVVPYGGVPFRAKVQAIDNYNMKSNWSSVETLNVEKDAIPPAVPTNLSAEALFQNVAVEWTPVSDNDLSEYILQVATDENFTQNLQTIHTETTRYTYAGETNTTYYFRVKAVDFSGNESAFSESVSASTVKLDADKLYDYTITSVKIADGAITNAKIENVTITDAKIANISADKITTGTLKVTDTLESPIIKVVEQVSGGNEYDAVLIDGNGITVNKGNITIKDGTGNETILDSNGVNANKITTGTIKIKDGTEAPTLQVVDDSNESIITIDKTGLIVNQGNITIKDNTGNNTILDGNGVNANTIKTGTLTLKDGTNNPNLVVLDASDNTIAQLDKDGLQINGGKVLIKDSSGQTIVDGNGVQANKIVGGVLQANSYIQVGDENKGYKLEGNGGLSLLFGGQKYKISSIIKKGIISRGIGRSFQPIEINGSLENAQIMFTPQSIMSYSDSLKSLLPNREKYEMYQNISCTHIRKTQFEETKEVFTPEVTLTLYGINFIQYYTSNVLLYQGNSYLPDDWTFEPKLPSYNLIDNFTFEGKNICEFNVGVMITITYKNSSDETKYAYFYYLKNLKQPHNLPLSVNADGIVYKRNQQEILSLFHITAGNELLDLSAEQYPDLYTYADYSPNGDLTKIVNQVSKTIPDSVEITNMKIEARIAGISTEESRAIKTDAVLEYIIFGD